MTTGPEEISPIAWVRVSIRERKVVDVDGEVVTLEFTLDLPDDKAWYQCFAQSTGPHRTGSSLFVDTNPHFLSAEVLAWKIELSDIPQAAVYLASRVEEANDLFSELLERKEQIRRQLEEAARRRTEAIESAQRLLDESWPDTQTTRPTDGESEQSPPSELLASSAPESERQAEGARP